MAKPTIDVGPAIQESRLPGWLKQIFAWLRGVVIHAGPVDVQLDQNSTLPLKSGIDAVPHKPGPDLKGRR